MAMFVIFVLSLVLFTCFCDSQLTCILCRAVPLSNNKAAMDSHLLNSSMVLLKASNNSAAHPNSSWAAHLHRWAAQGSTMCRATCASSSAQSKSSS